MKRIAAERRKFEATLLQLRHEQSTHFERQQSARQIRLETAATTGAFAREQTCNDAGARRLCDGMRRNVHRAIDRSIALGDAAKAHHPAESRCDDILLERQAVEASDGAIHQVGTVATQAPCIERAIGEHCIGGGHDEFVQRRVVANDAALAAQPDTRVRFGTRRIAVARFDFDHFGAEVGQHHRGESTDGTRRGIDNAQIL